MQPSSASASGSRCFSCPSRSKAVQVLNRSQDDVALQLDAKGGVREVAVTAGRAVLSDALVQRLARAGAGIKQRFGDKDQDIEWAVQGDQLIILQARFHYS